MVFHSANIPLFIFHLTLKFFSLYCVANSIAKNILVHTFAALMDAFLVEMCPGATIGSQEMAEMTAQTQRVDKGLVQV